MVEWVPIDRVRPPARQFLRQQTGRELKDDVARLIEATARELQSSAANVITASLLASVARHAWPDTVKWGRADVRSGDVDLWWAIVDLSDNPRFDALVRRVDTAVEAKQETSSVDDIAGESLDGGILILRVSDGPERDAIADKIALSDVAFTISCESHSTEVIADYDEELFDGSTIEAFLKHAEQFLEAVLDEQSLRLFDVPIAVAGRPKSVDDVVPSADFRMTSMSSVVEAFERVARERPAAVAAEAEGVFLTYGALNARADCVASELAALGASRESLVGLWLPPSIDLVVAVLGTLKSGAAFLPLDGRWRPPFLGAVLREARPAAIIIRGSPSTFESVPSLSIESCVSRFDSGVRRSPGSPSAQGLACVVFEARTLAEPVGRMQTIEGLARTARAFACELDIGAEDSVLVNPSVGHGLLLSHVLAPLIVGGRLLLPPFEATLVGASVRVLSPRQGGDSDDDRHVDGCGAREAFPDGIVLRTGAGPGSLTSVYGVVTGPGGFVSSIVAPRRSEKPRFGIPRTSAREWCLSVLDDSHRDVSEGVAGEVATAGSMLGRGYWHRPDLTAAEFLPAPETRVKGNRVLPTSRLGRFGFDGALELLTRPWHPRAERCIRPDPVFSPIQPLSYHQERLWFIDEFERGNIYDGVPTYHNVPLVLSFTGSVNREALCAALVEIRRRHDILRVRLDADRLTPRWCEFEVFGKTGDVELLDCIDGSKDAVRDELEYAVELALRPIDIRERAPLRGWFVDLGESRSLLCLVGHHAILDRPSMKLVARELAALYAAIEREQVPLLPCASLQWSDFVRWERTSTDLEHRQSEYWRRRLGRGVEALELPTSHPRPAVQTFTAGRLEFVLPDCVSAMLGTEDAEGELSFLLTALFVALHGYTDQREIVVGIPEARRNSPARRGIVGPLENLLVIASEIEPRITFRELEKQIRSAVHDARRHGDLDFNRLVQDLRPEKDMSRTALFDVLFEYDPEPPMQLRFGHAIASDVRTPLGYGKYDLNLLVHATTGGHVCSVVYNTDLFDESAAERLLGQYSRTLESCARRSHCSVDDIALLSEAEERVLLTEWNDTEASYPDVTIMDLIERQVERRPDATAVTWKDQYLSYQSLDRKAGELACRLRSRSVPSGSLVGVCCRRNPDLIVGILAILKAGAGYLPVDPDDPDARIRKMLADAGVAFVVGSEELARTAFDGVERVHVGGAKADSWRRPSCEGSPSGMAYCIYTSGSTGEPKGVLISQRNVVRLVENDAMPMEFGPGDVWSLFHRSAFDFSVWELFVPLCTGGRVVIVPDECTRDLESFGRLIVESDVTVLNQTPSTFYTLIDVGLRDCSALRYVIFGGEALREERLVAWKLEHPQTRLVNMYGITETTVHVTFKELSDSDLAAGRGNVGRPIPTVRVYVANRAGQLVPQGVRGEMLVGGMGVGQGYLGRPARTAERFVPDAFSNRPGQRLYRSGDIGSYTESGELLYAGRGDRQVKLRGFRIEPQEIETKLDRHEAVKKSFVQLHREQGREQLVAHVEYRRGDRPTQQDLEAYLSKQLPLHMVPAAFVAVDSWPLTASGKLDASRLVRPGTVRRGSEAELETELEIQIAGIWKELLSRNDVGPTDNFFEVGGHSLIATQLVMRVREVTGVMIRVSDVFQRSLDTVRKMARAVEIIQQTLAGDVANTSDFGVSREGFRI